MLLILNRYRQDHSGATSIEYSLIAALMAVGLVICLSAYGPSLLAAFNRMGADMATPPDVTTE